MFYDKNIKTAIHNDRFIIKRKPTFRYGGEYHKHDDCIKR